VKLTSRAPQCVKPERSPQAKLTESVWVKVKVAAAVSNTVVVRASAEEGLGEKELAAQSQVVAGGAAVPSRIPIDIRTKRLPTVIWFCTKTYYPVKPQE